MSDENTPIPAGTSADPANNQSGGGTPPPTDPNNQGTPPPPAEGAKPAEGEGAAPAAPGTPPEGGDKAVLEKRLKGAISKVEETNADYARAVETQVSLVKKSPELINQIADSDIVMANRVIEKTWGHLGIRTYKQLQEQAELQKLKDEDPVAYESKKETLELKRRLDKSEQKTRDNTLTDFLTHNSIRKNDYDPKYQKLQKALEALNPVLVEDDYGKALQIAHSIAFGQALATDDAEPDSVEYGSGQPPTLPTGQPQYSKETNWLTKRLRARGHKVALS